jgi:hypothetical protein
VHLTAYTVLKRQLLDCLGQFLESNGGQFLASAEGLLADIQKAVVTEVGPGRPGPFRRRTCPAHHVVNGYSFVNTQRRATFSDKPVPVSIVSSLAWSNRNLRQQSRRRAVVRN